MALVRNRFTDPATGDTYEWHRNHGWEGEDSSGLQLGYSFSATSGGAPLPQYGEIEVELRTLRGTILHRAQHEAFKEWATLCKSQTIYFRDFDMLESEVVILRYRYARVGLMKNPVDPTMPLNKWTYELELQVVAEEADVA